MNIRKNILAALSLAFFSSYGAADVERVALESYATTDEMQKAVAGVLHLIDRYHYRGKELDDELSMGVLERYIEALDPSKSYFIQGDIDAFQHYRQRLDDELQDLNLDPAFDIFKVYRQRVTERSEFAVELLDTDFDFDRDEVLGVKREDAHWAKTTADINQYWRLRVKNDVLNLTLSDKPDDEIKDTLSKRYLRQSDRIAQMLPDDVFEIFINAYAGEIEPHTSYFSRRTAENFRIQMSLSLTGIGAALQTEFDYVVVNRILPGGPADKSGLLGPEDRIIAVGQEKEEMVNVIGWRLMDVVDIIRGSKGTKVSLEVLPSGSPPGAATTVMEFVRDKIKLEEQAAKRTEVSIDDGLQIKNFAVVTVPSFYSDFQGRANRESDYRSSTRDVRKLLSEFDHKEVDGLIVDLRGNGGGSLEEATDLTGLFIPSGPIVQIRYSNGKVEAKRDSDTKTVYDGPLLVMVDRYSASASEIFAAAIQDYGRGVVVGERTFGKGTVQQLQNLDQLIRNSPELGQFKFTSAQFFRINGNSTQHRGVIPDIELNTGISTEEDYGERSLDNALPWALIQPAMYKVIAENELNESLLEEQHQTRTLSNPAFTFLRDRNAAIAKARESETVSLNKLARSQEREKIEQDNLDRLNQYRIALGLAPVTLETIADSELPGGEDHWKTVMHTEAANILNDQLTQLTVAGTELTSTGNTKNESSAIAMPAE